MLVIWPRAPPRQHRLLLRGTGRASVSLLLRRGALNAQVARLRTVNGS
jgi:hypothetical protein